MKTVEICLLARRRKDGKFLRLFETQHTANFDFVDDPALAKRVILSDDSFVGGQPSNIQPAPYYFENSHRARNAWLVDCEMVPYEVTTEVVAIPMNLK